jgi:hypothetical protein
MERMDQRGRRLKAVNEQCERAPEEWLPSEETEYFESGGKGRKVRDHPDFENENNKHVVRDALPCSDGQLL